MLKSDDNTDVVESGQDKAKDNVHVVKIVPVHDADDHDNNEKTEEPTSKPPVQFSQMFRFASRNDYIFMFFGSLGSLANGLVLPLFGPFF